MKKLPKIKSKPIPLSLKAEKLVDLQLLYPDNSLILCISPRISGVGLKEWAVQNKDMLKEKLLQHGAILFRGFEKLSPTVLHDFIEGVSSKPLEYAERSSPRTQVEGNIYTSTDFPPNYRIFMHNENSYQSTWPMRLFFMCDQAPTVGGETPIANCRNVLNRISPPVRAEFEARGFRIVRNFGPNLGLDWKTVFQSDSRERVDSYCSKNGIQTQWLSDEQLRTITIRDKPIATHPVTGEKVWFNHGTFFHISSLEMPMRKLLEDSMDPMDLPSNTFYGDGAEIEPDVTDHLRDAYEQEMVSFKWEEGDLLMIDNMLTAHGRAPFQGKRRIVVGMSEPMDRNALA